MTTEQTELSNQIDSDIDTLRDIMTAFDWRQMFGAKATWMKEQAFTALTNLKEAGEARLVGVPMTDHADIPPMEHTDFIITKVGAFTPEAIERLVAEQDEARQDYKEQREYADEQYRKVLAAEAREVKLRAERDTERAAWAGIERKASNLRHRLDALEDAARRASHGDHTYDADMIRTDCRLCAAIEGRYQPSWMEEPHEWMGDPVARAALADSPAETEGT